jgi:Yip1 domain
MSEPEIQMPDAPTAPAPPQPQEQVTAEEPARLGPFARLSNTLLSPGETFEDVNRKPTWIAPMIIAIATVLAGTFFFQWRASPDWDLIVRNQLKKQMEARNQSLTDEQMQQQVNIGKKIAQFIPLIAAVFTPIVYVILAGIFAVGLMFIQAKTTFKKILSVVAWSYTATAVVQTIVTMASLMVRDEESLKTIDPTQGVGIVPSNIGTFLSSDTSAAIKSLAGSLDIFSIWFLILMSIGFSTIAGSRKIKTGNTATMVFGSWVVFVLLKAGLAALRG